MLEMLRRLPRAQWLISTLGEKGSILLQRPGHGAMAPNASVAELDSVLGSLFSQVTSLIACCSCSWRRIRAF